MVSGVNMSQAESPSHHVTVVDVYDLASVIGKDFEHIIDKFGAESIAQLMPKVISALELLEAFATRNERENEEVALLKTSILRLESEKAEKKEGRLKFETEMEQMEENYRNEIRQLWDMVRKVQEENKRLSANLEQKLDSPTQQALKEEELAVMLTLQDNVDKQRDALKVISKECENKSSEIESLQRSVEKLQRTNKELLRKNKAVQNQGRALVEEKADLISVIQDRDQCIAQLQIQLGETEKARKDLEETKIEPRDVDCEHVPRFTLAELREVLQEKNQLKARVMELEEELTQLRPEPTSSPNHSDKNEEEQDLVVYGPINREPEEKLFPWKYERKDSGVRNFFMTMFRKRNHRSACAHGSESFGSSDHFSPAHSSFVSSSKTFRRPDRGTVRDSATKVTCHREISLCGIREGKSQLTPSKRSASQLKNRQRNSFHVRYLSEQRHANSVNYNAKCTYSCDIDRQRNSYNVGHIENSALDISDADLSPSVCDVDKSIEFSLCDDD